MNEAQIEAAIDRRVQARLSTDRDYLFAENAQQQAWAERKIELQEEIALYEKLARPTDGFYLADLRDELAEHMLAVEA